MHKVTVRKGFTGPQRQRAGIAVSREYPYTGELSEEQLKAVEADPELVVEEVAEGKKDDGQEETRTMVDVQPTKKELLEQAEAEGLVLEGLNARSKVDDIKAAIETARTKAADDAAEKAKEDQGEPEQTEETVTEGDAQPVEGSEEEVNEESTEEQTQNDTAEGKKD